MPKKNLRLLILGIIIAVIVVAAVIYYKTTISGSVVVYKTCTDSDVTPEYLDGKNYGTKGVVYYGDNIFEDECKAIGYVAETWCEKNIYSRIRHPTIDMHLCPNGCEDGVCL